MVHTSLLVLLALAAPLQEVAAKRTTQSTDASGKKVEAPQDLHEVLVDNESDDDEENTASLIDINLKSDGEISDDEMDAGDEADGPPKRHLPVPPINVATWNILAMDKSKNIPTGMFRFTAADKGSFVQDKVNFLKGELVRGKGSTSPDLIGLQEVDKVDSPQMQELWNHLKENNFEVVQGPPYESRDGLLDYSYLLYNKAKFKGHSCSHNYDKKACYMLCKMILNEKRSRAGQNPRKLRIATGHSASSGLAPPVTQKKNKKTGEMEDHIDKDSQAIKDFAPVILFGDFNTKTENVLKALPQFTSATPDSPKTSTMKKTVYVYRKLLQGIENTKNWQKLPANAQTCAGFMENLGTFKAKSGKKEEYENEYKYGKRWCDISTGDKSWGELEKAFKALGKTWKTDSDEWKTTKLADIAESYVWCTNPLNGCTKIHEKHLDDTIEDDEGQEDGIVTTTGATLSPTPVRHLTKLIEAKANSNATWPNEQWMSDHFIVSAQVSITADLDDPFYSAD